MKSKLKGVLLVVLLALCAPVWSADVNKTIRLITPSQNVDGTALADLIEIRIYWGFASRVRDGGVQTFAENRIGVQAMYTVNLTIPDVAGTVDVFFDATAVDSQGNESAFSATEVMSTFVVGPDTVPPEDPDTLEVIDVTCTASDPAIECRVL